MDTITAEENKEVHHEHSHHTARSKRKFELTTPVAIILAAFILGVSHVAYAAILKNVNKGPVSLFAGAPITKDDFPTGNLKSDVIVVEYSDTECPFCSRLHPVMNRIQSEYSDKVTFVYRHFPLTQIHPGAFGEAQAIECIGEQLGAKKRREYIDQMFQYKISSGNMTLPKNGKEDLAKNFGVDMKTFNACVASEASAAKVTASIQDGVAAGVSGTPATFILKKDGDDYEMFALIEGAREYEYFKAALDAALE